MSNTWCSKNNTLLSLKYWKQQWYEQEQVQYVKVQFMVYRGVLNMKTPDEFRWQHSKARHPAPITG